MFLLRRVLPWSANRLSRLVKTPKRKDFAGLRRLANLAGAKFVAGVVLYDGAETLPFGDRLWAAPVSTLWTS